MGIMTLLVRGVEWTRSAGASRRRERRHRKHQFVSSQLEQFEDRIVLSTAFTLYNAGTEYAPAGLTGFTATTPTEVSLNNTPQIKLQFTNGTTAKVTVGVAVYQDPAATVNPSDPTNTADWSVQLSSEVLLGFQYYTMSPGSCLTVYVGDMMCIEVDSFIHAVNCTTVSNPVTYFTTQDQNYAGSPYDNGYNYTQGPTGTPTSPDPIALNSHATANGPPTGNIVGTQVTYCNTTGPANSTYPNGAPYCPPGPCESECFWENNPCDWEVPSFTTAVTSCCGKTEYVTVNGLSLGDTFYSINQLEDILHTSCAYGNAALTLAQEEIYAKLNIINNYEGTSQYPIASEIAALTKADTDLATYLTGPIGSCGGYVWVCSTQGQVLLADAQALSGYNTSCNCGCGCGYGNGYGCNYNSCDQVAWCSNFDTNCGNSWGNNSCGVSGWGSDSCDNSCFSNSCFNPCDSFIFWC